MPLEEGACCVYARTIHCPMLAAFQGGDAVGMASGWASLKKHPTWKTTETLDAAAAALCGKAELFSAWY